MKTLKDQIIVSQKEVQKRIEKWDMTPKAIMNRSWITALGFSCVMVGLSQLHTYAWEWASVVLFGLIFAVCNHAEWTKFDKFKEVLNEVRAIGQIGMMMVLFEVLLREVSDHLLDGNAQNTGYTLMAIGILWHVIDNFYKFNLIEERKEWSPMGSEHCAEVLKWTQEDQDVENYVNAIKKEERPILNKEFEVMKQWMDESKLRKIQEQQKEDCLKLYS